MGVHTARQTTHSHEGNAALPKSCSEPVTAPTLTEHCHLCLSWCTFQPWCVPSCTASRPLTLTNVFWPLSSNTVTSTETAESTSQAMGCLMFTICLFPAPINSLTTRLPGKLGVAPHAPSPGWHAFCYITLYDGLLLQAGEYIQPAHPSDMQEAHAAAPTGCDSATRRGTCGAAPSASQGTADGARDADAAPSDSCDILTRTGTSDAAPSSSQTTADGARAAHADDAREADAVPLDSCGTATCERSQSSEAKRRAIQVQHRHP